MLKISGLVNTGTAFYNAMKSTIASHGGWTNMADTYTNNNTWNLEYQSTATAYGATVRVRFRGIGTNVLYFGFYNNAGYQEISAYSAGFNQNIPGGVKIIVEDTCICMARDVLNTSGSDFMLGNIFQYNGTLLTGRNCHGVFHAGVSDNPILGGTISSTNGTVTNTLWSSLVVSNTPSSSGATGDTDVYGVPPPNEFIVGIPIQILSQSSTARIGQLRSDLFLYAPSGGTITAGAGKEFNISGYGRYRRSDLFSNLLIWRFYE